MWPCGDVPARRRPGLLHRGQEATGGTIEVEPTVLPRRALTESRQSLHIAPDGSGIRLILLRQAVRLRGLLLRHVESPHDRVEYRVARRTELLGGGPQEEGAIGGRVRVEGGTDRMQGCRPCLLDRRADVPAPEASHVLKTPEQVIRAAGAIQKQVQGEGGGSYIAVPEYEPAEQAGMGGVGGIVEIAVLIHEEDEHVPVPQIGAGRNPFSTVDAVLVAERQGPRGMIGPEVEHPAGQLVVVDARIAR